MSTKGFGESRIDVSEPLGESSVNPKHSSEDADAQLVLEILEQIQSIRSGIVSPSTGSSEETSSGTLDAEVAPPKNDCDAEEVEGDSPIHCTLPLLDEDFRDIVIDFVKRFDRRLEQMHRLLDNGEFGELAREAHWLKGSGGTVGYMPLMAPSSSLMHAAGRENADICRRSLKQIVNIRARMIVPPPSCPPASSA